MCARQRPPGVGRIGGVEALLWYGQLTTYLYFSRLSRSFSPGVGYRWLVTWPASWFSAAVFLGLPWSVARAFGVTPLELGPGLPARLGGE